MENKLKSYRTFICSFPNCEAAYNKEWKLDAHMCKHTGVKPHACEREGCGKSFTTKYHLARHELSHSGERLFPCTVDGCSDAFTTNANRQRHITRAHNVNQKPYVCDFDGCGLAFKKNRQLKSHQSEHTGLLPYVCSFEGCERGFQTPSKLKRHEKTHEGYPCQDEGCTFVGRTWTDLTKHRRDSHRVLVRCDICDKEFRDVWFLRQHQRIHSDQRQVFRCPRDGCGRSFTKIFNLQSHINSFHEELRPFICPHVGCGKAFSMRQSLQRHNAAVHDPDREKVVKPRPKRSLASRLSGFKPQKKTPKTQRDRLVPESTSALIQEPEQKETSTPRPDELVSILQDTTLLCQQSLTISPVMLPM